MADLTPIATGYQRPCAKILVVDDRAENILAVEALLAPLGQEIIGADSGEMALKKLLKHQVAVILLDVQMPGMDGYETARLIKERYHNRATPIIFLTAHDKDAQQIFKAYLSGAVDFLQKPLDENMLRSKVSVFVELYLQSITLKEREEQLRFQEAERLRAQGEERYRQLADAIPEKIWVFDADGELQYVNRTWCVYSDMNLATSKSDWRQLIHPDDLDALEKHFDRAAQAHESYEIEYRLRNSEGEYRWHLGRASFSHDEGWIATATDIHNQKTLYQERDQIARVLQKSLLPATDPTIPGLRLATRYNPAMIRSEVGGDFYDAFPLEGSNRWELVMGDVCGKGVEAASLTSLARYTIRAVASAATSPPEVLGVLNHALLNHEQENSLCTAAIAEIEPRGDHTVVHFSLAGHPRPLLLKNNGQVSLVGTHGALLGGLEDIEHIDDAVAMSCGDTLLLYTDGVTDSRVDEQSGRLEEEGLATLMQRCPSRYPEAVADYLLRNLGDCEDDVAIMAVQIAKKADYCETFDPEPAAVTGLRREMDRFADRFSKQELYNLKVMISEMTTNAVLHGARRPGDHFTLSWWEEEEFLRILIENPGPAFTPEPQIQHDSPGGRGIWLVSELADRWGITCHNAEVQVWAEKHWEK